MPIEYKIDRGEYHTASWWFSTLIKLDVPEINTEQMDKKHVSYKNGDGLADILLLKPLYSPWPFKQM